MTSRRKFTADIHFARLRVVCNNQVNIPIQGFSVRLKCPVHGRFSACIPTGLNPLFPLSQTTPKSIPLNDSISLKEVYGICEFQRWISTADITYSVISGDKKKCKQAISSGEL